MTPERMQCGAKLRITFLLVFVAAASYAQTIPTIDAQAFVTSPLSAKRSAAAESDSIRPFHINIPEQQIVELRERIRATRWPDKETVNDESQGMRLAEVQALVQYWGSGYDWRKGEAKLNA